MSSTQGTNSGGTASTGNVYIWKPTPFPSNATTQYAKTSPTLFISATCQASDAVGNFVCADSGANAVTTVTAYTAYPAIGCIVSKPSDTSCTIQTFGLCSAYQGLTANNRYFVGATGMPSLVTDLPSDAPYVQQVGFAVGDSQLFVQPSGIIYRRDISGDTPPSGSSDTPPSDSGDTLQQYPSTLLSGTGAPSASLGGTDYFYIQTDGQGGPILWGPKDATTGWSSSVSLVGQPGNRFYVGNGPPSASTSPNTNDIYFDEANVIIYVAS